MAGRLKLVLASGSPRRLALLAQIGVEPDRLMPVTIDEKPRRNEPPRSLAKRMAREKAQAAAKALEGEPDLKGALVLAGDTVVAVGRRILGKADSIDQAAASLRQLSGRSHRVFTALCLINPAGQLRQRLVETRVRFKRLSRQDVDSYIASGEWRGKAGGYAIQGRAAGFIPKINGSYSNVVGLPLMETRLLLEGLGWRPSPPPSP